MAIRSRVSFVRCIVLLTAVVGQGLLASNTWIRLATRDFELYSTLDQKRAEQLLRRLEETRQGMEQLSLGAQASPVPLRVFAFRSPSEYVPFRSDKLATAYYLHSGTRSYIVLGGDAMGSSEAAVHEYVHHILHQRFPHLPLWLDEGLAEVYSTVARKDGSLRLGLPCEGQLEWLRTDGLAYDLPALFRLEQGSFDHARHLTPRSRFYAESWLLAHMLRLSPEYAPGFTAFLAALDRGEPATQVFSRVYGKTTSEVMSDLKRYLDAERMPTELTAATQSPVPVTDIETTEVNAAEARAVLAGLLTALGRRAETSASTDAATVSTTAGSIN